MKICVLIPAHNEGAFIGRVISEIQKRQLDVVVVDDGSTDQTGAIAGNCGAIVLRNPQKSGKGFSLKRGLEQVMQWHYDAVITMDGDGQHDVNDLAQFITAAWDPRVHVVVGNRMDNVQGMPWLRLMTNRFMSWVISLICRQKVPDSQCGYRLIKREALKEISLQSSDFEIETEMLIEASKHGFKITSVPIRTIYSDEKSKINPFIDTVRFFSYIFRELFLRKPRP